jgi:2-polyprenyl-3-methyl-5-hydroxy-6-metoxy-1,4-benzoquinol methylase
MNEITKVQAFAEAEKFAERISDTINVGAVAAMLSLGHRAGLFEALDGAPPANSHEVADLAGLNERFVREWLAVMVTGGIVSYDPQTKCYSLPDSHAACLVPGAALGNLAVYAQHVSLLGKVEDTTLHSLRTGEGTAYGDYPCFHQIMAEDSDQTVAEGLFAYILPLIDGIEQRLDQGIEVLDAGCGRGHALIELARRFPNSRFTGYDLGADAIAHASETARREGLENVVFETRDLTGYAEPGRFDLVTSFDAVHDQKDPQGLIHGLHASLRTGGVYLMQDIGGSARLENNFDFPMASLLYAISCAHCTPISIGQGGAGLGTMWGWETAEAMLHEAGFSDVARHVLPHDPMNVWFVARV